MRKLRFKEEQIVSILKLVEGGRLVKDACRELGTKKGGFTERLTDWSAR